MVRQGTTRRTAARRHRQRFDYHPAGHTRRECELFPRYRATMKRLSRDEIGLRIGLTAAMDHPFEQLSQPLIRRVLIDAGMLEHCVADRAMPPTP